MKTELVVTAPERATKFIEDVLKERDRLGHDTHGYVAAADLRKACESHLYPNAFAFPSIAGVDGTVGILQKAGILPRHGPTDRMDIPALAKFLSDEIMKAVKGSCGFDKNKRLVLIEPQSNSAITTANATFDLSDLRTTRPINLGVIKTLAERGVRRIQLVVPDEQCIPSAKGFADQQQEQCPGLTVEVRLQAPKAPYLGHTQVGAELPGCIVQVGWRYSNGKFY